MSGDQADKKHPATERRREQARREGQVSKSADLSSAAMLMIALLCLRWLGGPLCGRVATGLSDSLSGGLVAAWSFQDAMHQLFAAAALLALATLPLLSLMFLSGIVVNVSQTGLLLTPSAVAFKWKHVSPLGGIKRIASVRGLMRLGFGVFKVLVIAAVAYLAVRSRHQGILAMGSASVPVLVVALFENLFGICIWIATALLALGALEYAFQRWRYEQDLKMTDQELRDEMKESQGDPQTQQQRGAVRRRSLTGGISRDVAAADVVITYRAELAIAICYRPHEMIAPRVVAKGAGPLTQQIRRLALQSGVPVVERPQLSQFLYKTVELGGTVPADQYVGVAEVLRYVYQLRGL
jgi:flagellar biosynthesis protein FlhB